MVLSQGHCCAACWTGNNSDSSRSLLAAPAYSCSACPSGTCWALACADNRVVYVARNANGASMSFLFSARLKCTRPTRFHAGFFALRKLRIVRPDSMSSACHATSISCHNEHSTEAVRYSTPVIGGEVEARASSSSVGGGGIVGLMWDVSDSGSAAALDSVHTAAT